MSNPIIRIHNQETDEIIDREMTDEEYTEHQEEIAAIKTRDAKEKSDEAKRAALLTRLGITADEAKLLLG